MTVTEPYQLPVRACGRGCVGQWQSHFQPVIFSLQNHQSGWDELLAESHMKRCRREWAEQRTQRNQG